MIQVTLLLLVIVLLNLFLPRNKALYILGFVFLWVLFCFSSGLPDDANYRLHFQDVAYASDKGVGYYALAWFFNVTGLGFEGFRCVTGTLLLASIAFCGWNLTKKPGFLFAFYCIFPFCMDAVQLRFSFALSVVLFAYLYLIKGRANPKLRGMIFAVICLVTSTIHIANLFFIVILLADRFSIQRSAAFSLFFFIVITVSLLLGLQNTIFNVLGMSGRVRDSSEYAFSLSSIVRLLIPCALWILYGLFCSGKNLLDWGNEYRRLIGMNIMIASLFPLLVVAPDIYRIATSMFIVDYILAIQSIGVCDGWSKSDVPDIVKIGACFLIALVGLSLLVLLSTNLQDVLYPLLSNNILLSL